MTAIAILSSTLTTDSNSGTPVDAVLFDLSGTLLDETYSRDDWLAECARIGCPVQIVAGSRDHFPTVAMSERLRAAIPGARLYVVDGGTHFPNRSHRAEVQAVVGRFFDDIGV